MKVEMDIIIITISTTIILLFIRMGTFSYVLTYTI